MVETHALMLRAERFWPARRGPRQQEVELPAARFPVYYVCPRGGHEFEVVLAADITSDEVPLVWQCRRHGVDGKQLGYEDVPLPPPVYRARGEDGRTHYDRVLERRSRAELAVLLDERLADLAACRRANVAPTRAPSGSKTARGQ